MWLSNVYLKTLRDYRIAILGWGLARRIIIVASLSFALETRAAALGRALREDDVERITWERLQEARSFSAADYARAVHTVHRTGRVVARFLERYDVLLTPTMAKPPHPLGVLSLSNPDSAAFLADNRSVFGELADEPRFVGVYLGVLESLRSRGVRATLADLDRFAL